ncbi:MAG: acetylxylan esterase [Bacteroidales bacterium]|nr:acetylxylan esterase [Bacteroidales bacterium]
MNPFKSLFLAALLLIIPLSVFSQAVTLSLNEESGVYKKGEKIVVKASSEGLTDSLKIKVIKNHKEVILEKAFAPNQEDIVFENTCKEPCSVIIEARIGNQRRTLESIGCVVAPEKFRPGFERPKDLDQYWADQKSQLAAVPINPKTKALEVPEADAGYVCFDVELDCLGPKPARGYFAKPAKAAEKSLPIIILVRAAGVSGNWCQCNVNEVVANAKLGNGALSFDLNAHGMLNGQPIEYYRDLERGELKNYSNIGIQNREEFYFRGMYLRLLRTIEYLTQQPEWDGKRILVIGESQGGGQAAAAAGLDPRVSAVVLHVPAMLDWGGALIGRRGGWPQPVENNATATEAIENVLPYFDGALLLKNSKATIFAEIGLIDTTCPSTGVYAAINQSKGKKIINPVTYRQHSWPTGKYRTPWEQTFLKERLAFIDNYLK